jgi:pyruvate dehydrogenase E1 component
MTKPPFGRENKPVSENFKAPDHLVDQLVDTDPTESSEWRQSFDAVLKNAGPVRARYLMLSLLQRANEKNVGVSGLRTTDYINTIPPALEPTFPGDEYLERRIRAFIRWNAAVMVHRAQRPGVGVGGHISTYASSASLYEVGFNHFFRGKDHPGETIRWLPPRVITFRWGLIFLSTSKTYARVLAVPNCLNGTWPN